MSSTSRPNLGSVVRRHVLPGALVGALAYVVSYALTFAFVVLDGASSESLPGWKLAGQVLYSAHNVESVAAASGAGLTVDRSFNLIGNELSGLSDIGSTVPAAVYYVVPVVVLLVAGLLVVRSVDGRSLPVGTGAVAGATVAVGYLVLGILGAFLFRSSGEALGIQASIAPDLLSSVLLLGVVYPVVLGAAGGALAVATR